MIAGGCSAGDADKILSDYLTSGDVYAVNIVHLDVEPGRWRIHSVPDFAKRIDRARFGIPEGIEPWLLLEPTSALCFRYNIIYVSDQLIILASPCRDRRSEENTS